jgi:hypothetical protein
MRASTALIASSLAASSPRAPVVDSSSSLRRSSASTLARSRSATRSSSSLRRSSAAVRRSVSGRLALAYALAGALLVGLDREQVERELLVLGRLGPPRTQLLLHSVERGLGLLGLGVRGLAAFARGLEPQLHLLFTRLGLLEALAHPGGLLRSLLGAPQQARSALAQQHDLVLGGHAGLLAVLEAALRGHELALEFEQRQLAVGERGLAAVELGREPFAANRLLLPLVARLGLAFAQRVDGACGQRQVEVANVVAKPLEPARLADLARERAQLALDLEHDVVQAREVVFGGVQLAERFLLALLVLGDAGRLLEQEPAMAGVVREDVVHHRALDDRVRMAAHARVEEQVADVAQPARRLVEEVLGHAGTEHAA